MIAEHFLSSDPISADPDKLKLYAGDLARIIQHAIEPIPQEHLLAGLDR
jgi:hypothetical protein